MKQTDPQLKLRLPPDLKADVEAFAAVNHRSMNAEIVAQLQTIYSVKRGLRAVDVPPGSITEPLSIEQQIAEISSRVRQYTSLIEGDMRQISELASKLTGDQQTQ